MDLVKRLAGSQKAESQAAGQMPAVEPRHISGQEFETVILGSPVPAVVDFWAAWCAPCRALAPSVARLAAEFEGKALVAKLDADEYPELIARYGIMGIPTVIYFQNGQEVDRVIGLTRYDILKNKLVKLLGLAL
jgi:thioredoxin 1